MLMHTTTSLPFFKFLAGRNDLVDDDILAVRDSAIDLGMDMDGRISGQLSVRLHRWATPYAVGRECYSLFQVACNTKFTSNWPLIHFVPALRFAMHSSRQSCQSMETRQLI